MLIIAAWIGYQRTQASISAYGVVERGFFGGTYGLAILFSTWSSVLGVYLTTRWWGVPMHFLTSGLCAAMFFVVLVLARRAHRARDGEAVVLVTGARPTSTEHDAGEDQNGRTQVNMTVRMRRSARFAT